MEENAKTIFDDIQKLREDVYRIANEIFSPKVKQKGKVKSWDKKEFLIKLFELSLNVNNGYFKDVSYYRIIQATNLKYYWDRESQKPTQAFFRFLADIRKTLKEYFQTDEAVKTHKHTIEILTNKSEKALLFNVNKISRGTEYRVNKYNIAEIFNIDGSVEHTLIFGMTMTEGKLKIKDFGLIMWERGNNISVLPIKEPEVILNEYYSKINNTVELKYISNKVNQPHEYRWEIEHIPLLVKDDKISYTLKHFFKRPFPLVYEDIVECPNYYKNLKFAYDGITGRSSMPFLSIYLYFPLEYKIWDCGFFIEEGWSGVENEEERERMLIENCFSDNAEGKYRVLSLNVEHPNPNFTYSLKWNPPWRKDFPYLK